MVDENSKTRLDAAGTAMRDLVATEHEVSLLDLRRVAREIVGSSDLESLAVYELLDSNDVELVAGARVRLVDASPPVPAH